MDIEQEIRATLAAHGPEIAEKVMEQVKTDISNQISWTVRAKMEAEVATFYEAEIKPALAAILLENKPAILAGLTQALAGVGVVLVERMVAKATSSMESSYNMRQVVDAVFGR